MKRSIAAATLLSLSLLFSACGGVSKSSGSVPQTQAQGQIAKILDVLGFAENQNIPYAGMSASQLDTLCVNFTGVDLIALQAAMDQAAASIPLVYASIRFWYEQYKLNDQDFVNQCLTPGFPKTFTSVRTGASHTVTDYTSCRVVTSNAVSTEYVQYLNAGGEPATIAAKIKTSGCAGSAAPFNARLQSAHGSMIDDYRSIPAVYP